MDEIIQFRIAERITLTAVILLVSLVVMVSFWRTVQKVDFSDAGKLGLTGSFVFSTPVFVLLSLILYAWVSLQNPITVERAAAEEQVAGVQGSSTFIGSTPFIDLSGQSDPEYDITIVERRWRSLNCLASGQALSQRVDDDLVEAKLALLGATWPAEWGDRNAFEAWALGRSAMQPAQQAQEAWERRHDRC